MEKTSVSTQQVNPERAAPVAGFLPLEDWETFLDQHPDKDFAAFMRRGLTHGFRIGFDQAYPLKDPPPNFQSVVNNAATVDQYIANEVTFRLLAVANDPAIHTNPIRIILKPHQPGKFRLIVDL